MMRSRPFSVSVLLTILLYTVLVLALVFFSDRSDKHGALFDRSERLIRQHPDSAFELLRNVKHVDGFSLREKARYCLLLTKARDEAGIRHTGDSIITVATDFYSGTSGQYRTPEAWFYRGKVYEDMDLPSRALECYLKACMLTKIGVSANQITRILKYNSSVLRPRLFKKFFKKEGSTEAFVDFIAKF